MLIALPYAIGYRIPEPKRDDFVDIETLHDVGSTRITFKIS